jgi:hypothetical protein
MEAFDRTDFILPENKINIGTSYKVLRVHYCGKPSTSMAILIETVQGAHGLFFCTLY